MGKYLSRKYLGLLFTSLISLSFVYMFFTKEEIKSKDDLMKIEGRMLNYDFKEIVKYKRTLHQYYLTLDTYSNLFQIPADYLNAFEKQYFLSTVRKGDIITLSIAKGQVKLLNTDQMVRITSITSQGRHYLRQDDVIEIEQSNTLLYGALLVFGVGIIIFRTSKN